MKSTAGIATLLAEGIGDTIRVSLAEDPLNEIPVCYEILQALGLRKTQVEYIACPSCGRTKFNLPTVLREVRDATRHLVGLDIAVMGCIVNGPGEMAGADYGYVGAAGGKITLYRGREVAEAREKLDCLKRFRARVTEGGQVPDGDLDRVDADVARLIDESVAEAKAAPRPGADDLLTDVYVSY